MIRRALCRLLILLLCAVAAGCGGKSEPYSMPEDPGPPPMEPPQGLQAPVAAPDPAE
jgi:hypothetical protein